MTDEPFRSAYDRPGSRRFGARDAIVCIAVAALLLAVFRGPSIERTGEEMESGILRTAVLAVGKPASAVSDAFGLGTVGDDLVGWLSPDDELAGPGSFEDPAAQVPGRTGIPPVTPEQFDPAALGEDVPPPRELDTLLVTGDSLATPLDTGMARRLSGEGIETVRDPHMGTGISKSDLVDWGRLSVQQVSNESPDAVVVFIGANEGFPLPRPGGGEVECCGPDWAAAYASRARRMMDTYRQGGEARVYWLNLPVTRDGELARIARTVNAAIAVAAQPFRAHVRVLDMATLFTPGGRYRDAMDVDGRETIVRESDGIHLNAPGSELAADRVLEAVGRDFGR